MVRCGQREGLGCLLLLQRVFLQHILLHCWGEANKPRRVDPCRQAHRIQTATTPMTSPYCCTPNAACGSCGVRLHGCLWERTHNGSSHGRRTADLPFCIVLGVGVRTPDRIQTKRNPAVHDSPDRLALCFNLLELLCRGCVKRLCTRGFNRAKTVAAARAASRWRCNSRWGKAPSKIRQAASAACSVKKNSAT